VSETEALRVRDGSTVALAGLDGGIRWLRLPRFDSEPLLCGLLDAAHGGHFTVTPDGLTEAGDGPCPGRAHL
jgi:alpha,alpha-trehalase